MNAAALKGPCSMTIVDLPDAGPPPCQDKLRVVFCKMLVLPDA